MITGGEGPSRIASLRRRDWTTSDPGAVAELSAALNPSGQQTLRPIQAMAIRESLQIGGVWLAARVGAGKTLVAAILATLYADQRPLVLIPGGHEDKTLKELGEYRKLGWQLSHTIQLGTYSELARDVDEQFLRKHSPGRIICDEVDKLRRVGSDGSGTARRVAAWMASHPTYMDAMSGTMWKEGMKDYAHIVNWCLKDRAPVPELARRISDWHFALKDNDASKSIWRELTGQDTGPDFCRAYRERLWTAPGVIISIDCFDGVPLTIRKVAWEADSEALETLYASGERPDGLDTVDEGEGDAEGIDGTWAVQRQLALGFYYTPDPEPPEDWRKARRAYFKLARRMIGGGVCNTELQARRLCEKAQDPIWLKWKAIQPTFRPNFVPVWQSDRAIEECKAWGQQGGIVWTDHRAFAARLSAETGWRWFAGGGKDSTGLMIENCSDRTVIASRQANSTGRNLHRNCGPRGEGWHRALITAWPGNGRDAEQLLGRQHRDGQMFPVAVDVLTSCRAHHADIVKVMQLSEQEAEEMGRRNKVLTAAWR